MNSTVLALATILAAAYATSPYHTVCTHAVQTRPELLFGTSSCPGTKQAYRALALIWHPDKNPESLPVKEQDRLFVCLTSARSAAMKSCTDAGPRRHRKGARSTADIVCIVLATCGCMHALQCCLAAYGTRRAAPAAPPLGRFRDTSGPAPRMRSHRIAGRTFD